jgi:dienelactone hydrolase
MRPALAAVLALLTLGAAGAEDPRLAPPRDLDGYFPFHPPESAAAWTSRAEELRLRLRVALGLWPEPPRTPLQARVYGRVERDDFTVERVRFQSLPGLWVTGSLFRPRNAAPGQRPAVLSVHGHWADGRFHLRGEAERRREIDSGGETLPGAAHSHIQARCVQLARLGCVVLQTDMLGYADSTQISFDLAHKFARRRPELEEGPDGWGFYSARAEGELQSILGLQTWNNIRALDFLATLPDVDPTRLGVTGASGGGTQTFLLGAVDDRPAALFPAVMVSTAMQGGCTCENACLLRTETGNVELAALAAPRPLALASARDWTLEMPTRGFPELQRLYRLLGAPDRVQLVHLPQFGHNFNAPSRAGLYAWFNRHLALGKDASALAERDFTPLTRAELTVWGEEHPAPTGDEGGPTFERRLLRDWQAAVQPRVAADPARRAAGWRALFPLPGRVAPVMEGPPEKQESAEGLLLRGVVRDPERGIRVAASFLYPPRWDGRVALWLDDREAPGEEVRLLARAGVAVIQSRLFAPDAEENPVVKNPREAAAYTYGYNPTRFARRVEDAALLIRYARAQGDYPVRFLAVAGVQGLAPIAAAVRVLAGDAVDRVAMERTDFRWAALRDWRHPDFLPGATRYGDLPGLLDLPGPPCVPAESARAVAEALLAPPL